MFAYTVPSEGKVIRLTENNSDIQLPLKSLPLHPMAIGHLVMTPHVSLGELVSFPQVRKVVPQKGYLC